MPRTDFSTWQRETLERFAREVADENLQLRADVRTALNGYRREVLQQAPQQEQDE
ncbi:hypothetical protein [Comamonas odontotermitis]|uniref:hypothetical protein n=1 Tax=Comamonas odontotermitis TaxID=379895 RepID=UPI003751F667